MISVLKDRLKGCLVGGGIGDGVGSLYENRTDVTVVDFERPWQLTDDTQLTLATLEAIVERRSVRAEKIADKYLEWYNKGKLTGLGASTLKALRDLQVGAHWALAGRSGEYAAGNGAAMRIAPLAFFISANDDRLIIKDVCNITHKNDEAYTAALALLRALEAILNGSWTGYGMLIDHVTPLISDTRVRDNLLTLQIEAGMSIRDAASLIGCSGHAAESVPLALFAAGKIKNTGFADILSELICCGGDTDTNASIAGQVMGTFLGYDKLPAYLTEKFSTLKESVVIDQLSELAGEFLNSRR